MNEKLSLHVYINTLHLFLVFLLYLTYLYKHFIHHNELLCSFFIVIENQYCRILNLFIKLILKVANVKLLEIIFLFKIVFIIFIT